MDEVILFRIPGTQLFVNCNPPKSAGTIAEASFCFFHAPATARQDITFTESLMVKGAYAFIPPNAANPFSVLIPFLQRAAQGDGTYYFWMNEKWANAPAQLRIINASTAQRLSITQWAFEALPDTGTGSGTMTVTLPKGTAVVFDAGGILLKDPGIQLEVTVYKKTIKFAPDAGSMRINIGSGPRCATFEGRLSTPDTGELISAITPQVRYAWIPRGSTFPTMRAARILSDRSGDHVGVAAAFQLHRYTSRREYTRINLISTSTSAELVSELPDTSGQLLAFRPDVDAAIYFDVSPQGISHASLMGKFAVKPAPSAAFAGVVPVYREVMPGSSGTEFFQLEKDGYNGVEFFPAQPAFVAFGAGSEEPTVCNAATTAWMAPCRTGTATAFNNQPYSFVTQPQDQPLFGRRDVVKATQNVDAYSVLFDPAPLTVETPPGLPLAGLPFFPFRGIRRKTLDGTQQLDSEALGPIRSRLAAEWSRQTRKRMGILDGDDKTWITTPQGLLVQIDAANVWHTIKLGETADVLRKASDGWMLSIDRPKDINGKPVERWALQEALSRPDVFVVVTRKGHADIPNVSDPPFGKIDLAVKIAGWPMVIGFADTSGAAPVTPTAAAPSTFEPVMVMKLSKGPIEDLLADVGRWSLARIFNADPTKSSVAAVQSFKNLQLLSQGYSPLAAPDAPERYRKIAPELVSHYQEIYDKIKDDNWTGILIFNAQTPFDKVPDDVSVVTQGGANVEAFAVPVLGIDVSRVVPDKDGVLVLEKTSAFGAIHFHAPAPMESKGDFKFELRTLNAVFSNSELRTFLASMQLRLSRFFGAESSEDESVGDSRVLDILARYESKSAVGGTGEYVFRALGRRSMKFKSSDFLSGMAATRIDVTCKRKGDEPHRYVESRFGLWGELEFGSKFSGVSGMKKIEFENAALIMGQGKFDIDIGNIRVDFKKEGANSDGGGLLANFPLQLSAMRWASLGGSLSLPSVGYTGLSLPGLVGFDAPSFDFGLELDLNLGSMGKLFEAANFLKARIIIGWYDVKNPLKGFSVGFRFDGGNGPLDIGINGVLRLTADSVNVQSYDEPNGIGIGLLNPQLEVMGYKVPQMPSDTLVAFIPSGKDNVAWGWARSKTEVGPLVFDYFAIGQRMRLVPDGAFGLDKNLEYIVGKSKDLLKPADTAGKAKLPKIGELYIPEAGWGVVASGNLYSFKFQFVFLDGLDRYGLGLDIPKLAKIDVIYRKLSDGQGVFSAEIEPGFRTLEMGAATVTLPVLGFDAVTNGDWSINIGYHGNDFSRGTTVQVLPFLGSGGMRFGKLDWQSSYVLNSPDSPNLPVVMALKLDPVIEMSLAARIGLGKEFREGVFAAGITLSVYGIFEGAVGTPNHPKFPSNRARRYIRIDGTVGLLLEIFGVASFSLISAVVSIRVWVEAGVTFESYAPVLFHAEAGVSVFVRFVIARFSVFGRSWEIAIEFSFATRVRFSQKIVDSFDGPLPPEIGLPARAALSAAMLAELAYQEAQPLLWVPHKLAAAPKVLLCAVSVEPMMSASTPVMQPMLLASAVTPGSGGLDDFCAQLFEWALRLSLGVDPAGQTPARVKLSALQTLAGRVTPPKGGLSRWGAEPLDFAAVVGFIDLHLQLELVNIDALLRAQTSLLAMAGNAAPKTAQGIMLPWLADIAVSAAFDDASAALIRDFRSTHSTPIDDEWEDRLHALLSESMPDYPKDKATLLKLAYIQNGLHALSAGTKEALDAITEDWAAALVQGIVHQALRIARKMTEQAGASDTEPDVELAKLLSLLKAPDTGGSVCIQVAQHASTFLHHGLRVPAVSAASSLALPELLKTEIGMAQLNAQGQECVLSFSPRPGFSGRWIKGATTHNSFKTADALKAMQEASKALDSRKIKLTLELEDSLEQKTMQARRFVARTFIPLGKPGAMAANLRMAAVPEALFALSQGRALPLTIDAALEDPSGSVKPRPITPRWYVKLEIRLEAAATSAAGKLGKEGTAGRAVYSVLSVDPRIRELMVNMNSAMGPSFVTKARLGFKVDGEQPAVPFHFLEDEEAFFFTSNMSVEPNPPVQRAAVAAGGTPDAPTFSRLGDSMAVAQMLWMSNTVNSPGFHLGFDKNDPIAHLFKGGAIASVSVIFELSPLPHFLPIIDGLLLDAAEAASGWVVSLTTPQVTELTSDTPDGQAAILVTRENPLYGLPARITSTQEDALYLAARYELVDYWTQEKAANIQGTASLELSRDSVMPVRVHMDESEQAALPPGGQPPTWPHRILVPLAKIGQRTAMRNAMASVKSAPDASPYEFVGTDLATLINVGVRDGAGHFLEDGKLDVTWKGDTTIRYRDALFKLQELPGMSATWMPAKGGANAAAIEFNLTWNADLLYKDDPKAPLPPERRQALVEQFRRYVTMVRMADFDANIRMTLDGTALGQPVGVKPAVLAWLEAVHAELEAPGAPKAQDCKLPTVRLPQALFPATTAKPAQISAEMVFSRRQDLCDPRVTKTSDDLWFASSPIGPKSLQTSQDWVDWSERIRVAFGGTFTLLRKVEGRIEPSRNRAEGATVWLLRRSMLSVRSPKATSASYFAPTPLAKTLLSGVANVTMPDGQREDIEVKDVDLNAVAGRASSALETMMAAPAGESLCRIVQPAGLYSRLAKAKKGVADAMAQRLETILDDKATLPDSTLLKFRDASRADTKTAFAATAVVNVNLPGAVAQGHTTFLWGTVSVSRTPDQNATIAFSPIRIPLLDAGVAGSFDVVVRWADPGTDPLARVAGAMSFTPQYVEVRSGEDIVGYQPSDWYEILWTGEIGGANTMSILPASGSEWTIPLPLRLVPPTPAILRHQIESATPDLKAPLANYIANAREWEYLLAFMTPKENHDTAFITVRFDEDRTVRSMGANPLFVALATFAKYEERVAELTGQLAAGVEPDAKSVELAVQIFERIAANLGSKDERLDSLEAASSARLVDLDTVLPVGKQLGEIHWRTPKVPNKPVRAALLHIDQVDSEERVVAPYDETDATVRYQPSTDVMAAFSGIANLSPRRLTFSGLDVMIESCAMPTLVAKRNARLLDGAAISESFIFETASVSTPNALVPHLAHTDTYDMSTGDQATRSVEYWLELLEKTLFDGAERAGFAIDVSARLKLQLVQDGSPQSRIYFKAPLPSIKGAPAMKDPQNSSPDWYKTLAGHLLTYIRRVGPDAAKNGFLELKVQVFSLSGSESKRPALSLENLQIPLSMLSPKAAFDDLQMVRRLPTDAAPPLRQIAAYIYARSRTLLAPEAVVKQARSELASFALSRGPNELKSEALPSPAELSTAMGREAWVNSAAAAVDALSSRSTSPYAVLVLGPADATGNAPEPRVRHWAMALDPSLVVRVAGPMAGVSQDGQDLGNLYLWGIASRAAHPVGKRTRGRPESPANHAVKRKTDRSKK